MSQSDRLQWTDDEVKRLNHVIQEYKVSKAAESTDWESVKSKYDDITQRFRDSLTAENLPVKFPVHITKNIVTPKFKAIRINFCCAVVSGDHSGRGRVDYLYFELCEAVWGHWGGSPALDRFFAVIY